MTLKQIQQDTHEWTSQFTPQYWNPHEILARLTEEVGELAREINHQFDPKKKKDSEPDMGSLQGEIGDILFTLACLANSKNIDLDET